MLSLARVYPHLDFLQRNRGQGYRPPMARGISLVPDARRPRVRNHSRLFIFTRWRLSPALFQWNFQPSDFAGGLRFDAILLLAMHLPQTG